MTVSYVKMDPLSPFLQQLSSVSTQVLPIIQAVMRLILTAELMFPKLLLTKVQHILTHFMKDSQRHHNWIRIQQVTLPI